MKNKKLKIEELISDDIQDKDLEGFETSLPIQIKRFLQKVVTVIKGYNLNKKKEQLIIAVIIDALNMDPSQLNQAIRKIKKSNLLNKERFDTPEKMELALMEIIKESAEYQSLPKVIKKHFLEIISTYGSHRESITRKSDIRETAETLGTIADAAQEYTLREGGDWFDRVTIKRNMKELKGLCEKFEKEASLAKEQEQRMEALYEDMGHVLSRYFEIAEVSEAVMRERLGIKEKKKAVTEKAPEGWEGTVKAMKKDSSVDNPWALAHWMKNKGYTSHK
jgi:hypothetical protein